MKTPNSKAIYEPVPFVPPSAEPMKISHINPQHPEDFITYHSAHVKEYLKPSINECISSRHPSSWLSSLANKYTWTHREVEWHSAEVRFLFGAKTEDLCLKWICVLNWLVSNITPQSQQFFY